MQPGCRKAALDSLKVLLLLLLCSACAALFIVYIVTLLLQYSVPVSVLIFSGWLVSVVSLGYLFGIYHNSRYTVTIIPAYLSMAEVGLLNNKPSVK